jgi:hypothetical protein
MHTQHNPLPLISQIPNSPLLTLIQTVAVPLADFHHLLDRVTSTAEVTAIAALFVITFLDHWFEILAEEGHSFVS